MHETCCCQLAQWLGGMRMWHRLSMQAKGTSKHTGPFQRMPCCSRQRSSRQRSDDQLTWLIAVRRLHMQATKGDNAAERPMWAEKGGLDFEGRARWDAWTAVKRVKAPRAQLDFVKVPPLPLAS